MKILIRSPVAVFVWGGKVLSLLLQIFILYTESLRVLHTSALFYSGGRDRSWRQAVSPNNGQGNGIMSINLMCLVVKECPETTVQVPRNRYRCLMLGFIPDATQQCSQEDTVSSISIPLSGHCHCTHQHARQSGFPSAKHCSIKSTSE